MKKIRKMMAILIVAVLTMMLVPATVFAANLGTLTLNFTFTGMPESRKPVVNIGGVDYNTHDTTNGTYRTISGVDGSSIEVDGPNKELAEAAIQNAIGPDKLIKVSQYDGYDTDVDVTVTQIDENSPYNAIVNVAVTYEPVATPTPAPVSIPSGKGGNATITINLPTDNAGSDEEITYHVYKVFDATNDGEHEAIAYKIDSVNGDLTSAMTAAKFFLDDGGNVHFGTFTASENGTYMVGGVKGTITDGTENDLMNALSAIKDYAVDEITVEGVEFKASPSNGSLTITGLQYGYYYITTTTGTAVTVDSTNPIAIVRDKNEIPDAPDKTITGVGDGSLDEEGKNAIAQVGTTVDFSVDIVKVKGATNYVFHDVMTSGLDYNNDVKVYIDNVEISPTTTTPAGGGFSLTTTNFITTTAEGDDITVAFQDGWLAPLADNTTITIKYSATVTSDALNLDAAHNTATLDYGDGHTTDSDTVNVYNAIFTLTKTDGSGEALEGAGFKLSKEVAAVADDPETIYVDESDAAHTEYYKIQDGVVSWVRGIAEATQMTSEIAGGATTATAAFTGLADGTYTLIETAVPAGYNKAEDYTFTVVAGVYEETNLSPATTVINNAGAELPSTGGIGTTIFYIIGAILVIGGGIVLVTRRRMG